LSEAPSRESLEAGLRGLKDLRSASLLMIIAFILLTLALGILVFTVLASFSAFFPSTVSPGMGMEPDTHMPRPEEIFETLPPLILSMLALSVVLVITSLVVVAIAVFGKLLPGASKLSMYRPGFSTSATLIKVGFLGGLILFIIGLATLFIGIGVFLAIVAIILFLIGTIGLAILSLKLGSEFNELTFTIAGVLFIVSLILYILPRTSVVASILTVVAWILLYVGLGPAIEELGKKLQQALGQSAQLI